MKREKEDYSRESAIKRNKEVQRQRRDDQEYMKEYKRLIREKHDLGNTNKRY